MDLWKYNFIGGINSFNMKTTTTIMIREQDLVTFNELREVLGIK